jgi:hypothetical protein
VAEGKTSYQLEVEIYTVYSRIGNAGFMTTEQHAKVAALLEEFKKHLFLG